jgi:hypothetical protein
MPSSLPVKIEIQNSSSSAWLDISDGTTYRVNKSTFEESSVTLRRDEVTNAFIEGKFLVNALRENVTEKIDIYAFGATTPALKTAIDAVTALINQIQFNVRVTLDGSQRLWSCFASDYSVNVPSEFFMNRQALIKIQLQRLPSETVTTV